MLSQDRVVVHTVLMSKEQLTSAIKVRSVEAILAGRQTVINASNVFGVSRSSVYRWIERYDNTGAVQRSTVSGRPSKIDSALGIKIVKMLCDPASHYGYETDFWTTRRVEQVVRKIFKISVSQNTIRRAMRLLECSYRKPELRYYEANQEMQDLWRKKTIPLIKRTITKYKALLFFEDESTIQLTPVAAKTWAPRRKKIVQRRTGNRGSVSAISAISSSGHLLFNVFQGGKRFNSQDIITFLRNMLAHYSRRHIVVVMDQAPCHRSKSVTEFIAKQKRLHVFYLPPRSPEFNPDEKVWRHLKHNELRAHKATNLKELCGLTIRKLRNLARDKSKVRGIFKMSEGASFFN